MQAQIVLFKTQQPAGQATCRRWLIHQHQHNHGICCRIWKIGDRRWRRRISSRKKLGDIGNTFLGKWSFLAHLLHSDHMPRLERLSSSLRRNIWRRRRSSAWCACHCFCFQQLVIYYHLYIRGKKRAQKGWEVFGTICSCQAEGNIQKTMIALEDPVSLLEYG